MAWIANVGEPTATTWDSWDSPGVVCVSITDPGREAQLPAGFEDVLRLQFHDYEPSDNRPDAVLFSREQAVAVVRFAHKHRGKNVLVHCTGGVSRSGAIVDVLLREFPGYEDRGFERAPNGHVLLWMQAACLTQCPVAIARRTKCKRHPGESRPSFFWEDDQRHERMGYLCDGCLRESHEWVLRHFGPASGADDLKPYERMGDLYAKLGLTVGARGQYRIVADEYAKRGQGREADEVRKKITGLGQEMQ